MMNHYERFLALHQRPQGFILGNVWSVASARSVEQAGFEALGTSSAAMADALGYADGEQLPFALLLDQVQRIRKAVNLPLSVDIEGGYSRDPVVIVDHISQLNQLGVVGINIEDSVVSGTRELLPADAFAAGLKEIKKQLTEKAIQMFVNVRTDVFLLHPENALEITLERMRLYQHNGIDGIFIPGLSLADDVQCVMQEIQVPLNLMSLPNLTDLKPLRQLGVKRFSMGNFAYASAQAYVQNVLSDIQQNQSFQALFSDEQ